MDGSRAEPVAEIVDWAGAEDTVRAAVLTGSRADPEAPTDALSDYDICLFVVEGSGLEDTDDWPQRFGAILVRLDETVTYLDRTVPTRLVQYEDGLRIDFTLAPVDILQRIAGSGELPDWLDAGYRVLVDKDGIAADLPAPSGRGYVPERPGESEYFRVVNEFWWESIYVARNLARGEILPAKYSGECVMRFRCLLPMLEWYVQLDRGWDAPVGPRGRGLPRRLSAEDREALEASFAGADPHANWRALFAASDLFSRMARRVAEDLGYDDSAALADKVSEYLRWIRSAVGGGQGQAMAGDADGGTG